jgi:hypothetical protein
MLARFFGPGFVPTISLFSYEGPFFLGIRGLLVAGIFFWLRWGVNLERGSDVDATQNKHPWVGPVGLIVLVFTLTFVADDWIESGQAGWHSTAFPIVWISSQAVAGLALCVAAALASGAKPTEIGLAGRPLGNDWGNLLLATVFFWTYVSFGEFLIIWSGNKPDEIAWYLAREQGGWKLVGPVLAVGNFLVPFLLLLSRRLKENTSALGGLALLLVVGQIVYAAWLILPSAYPATLGEAAFNIALIAAAFSQFAYQFSAEVRRQEVTL